MNRLLEKSITGFAWLSTLLLLGGISFVLGYILYRGAGTLDRELIFGSTAPMDALLLRRQVFDGLFPAVAGTFCLTLLSVLLAVPAGVSTGIYLSQYAGKRAKRCFTLFFDILAGIPSIVVGLFGLSISIFLHKHLSARIYPCLLISAVSLAVLVLPYIIRGTQVSLDGLDPRLRITALSLGATRLQNIVHVLLPNALPGIVGGIILAVGRCAEDTAVIMLTGAVVSAGVPGSIFSHYEALPFYIYYISSQYSTADELATGYGASIILVMICLLLFTLAFALRKLIGRQGLDSRIADTI